MRGHERYPSVKKLTEAFGAEKAKAIRAIMEGPSMAADPLASSMKEESRLERIASVLGVETQGFTTNKWGGIRYCNMGHTYGTTIIRLTARRQFVIGDWGYYVEHDTKGDV